MPAKNPRTLCGCQSVAATSSTSVAPSRRESRSRHRCCLLAVAGSGVGLAASKGRSFGFLRGTTIGRGVAGFADDLTASAELRAFEVMPWAPGLGNAVSRCLHDVKPRGPRGCGLLPAAVPTLNDHSNACCANEVQWIFGRPPAGERLSYSKTCSSAVVIDDGVFRSGGQTSPCGGPNLALESSLEAALVVCGPACIALPLFFCHRAWTSGGMMLADTKYLIRHDEPFRHPAKPHGGKAPLVIRTAETTAAYRPRRS